ncbi:hypothetical protein A0256_11805 [Mucilaginibacter sp. PAMC 26640]|nr:hypothetical protein A0256_11805 [Mucilaginibacter sp. PAMC 26640]
MKINDQNAWEDQEEDHNYGSGSLFSESREEGHITDRGFSDDIENDSEQASDEDELDTEDQLDSSNDEEDDDLLDDDDDVPADTDNELDEDDENRLDDTEGGGTTRVDS